MTTFQACILGVVQGLSEILPISSSAHLVLVPWFFGWDDPGLAFDVFLHMGSLVALLIYFAREWFDLIRAGLASIIERKIGFERERLLFWLIVFASIPACVSGALFNHQAETGFRSPLLISVMLASLGFVLYWIDGNCATMRTMDELRMKDAIWVGLAQAFAIIPGVSRSGSTMTMGRLLGMNRETAARFSFLLAFPIILAAAGYEWLKWSTSPAEMQMQVSSELLIAGFASSTIAGLFSIHFLLRFLKNSDFRIFAWYRILLACVVVGWAIRMKG
ncbi:MAG: undecaprenyl-diphosphatase UppP [Deltaproteobacteria bacterium]|nr:undecaprenyl-diphosphatase UppP [Deltaproteobacteria bacterium]